MIRQSPKLRQHAPGQFNMTPMIDVVFQLIIFFMLACQYIASENFRLLAPDRCPAAVTNDYLDENAVTVSAYPAETEPRRPHYAVRARAYDLEDELYQGNRAKLVAEMAREIQKQVRERSEPIVYLRAHRAMRYGQVQDALAALAQAGVSRLQLAAYRDRHDEPDPGAGP